MFNEQDLVENFAAMLFEKGLIDHFVEIIFVDDGSTDATASRLLTLESADARFVIQRHVNNRGLGAAIRTGVISSKSDFVSWIPIDQALDLADILRVAESDSKSDVILFQRKLEGNYWRNAVSFILQIIFRILFSYDVRNQCGVFVIRRLDYLEHMPMSNRAISSLEFIVRVMRSNLSIEHSQVVVQARLTGKSKTFSIRSLFRSARELIGLLLLDTQLMSRKR